jgi:tetraacyldisaccharide 4'-kinase
MGIPLLLAETGAEGIVLDDCMQHRGVKPNLLFLLCPWNQPYFRETLLPSGNLREPKTGAKRAQALILTRVPSDLTAEKENR